MGTKQYELDDTFPVENGYVLIPTDKEGKTFPVLYLFHGTGEDSCETWIHAGNIENNINKWADEKYFSPMILVFPRIKRRSQDGFKHFVEQFSHYTDYIEKFYKPFVLQGQENTAVAGFSMGGAAALYCSHYYKTKFIHTAAFSPSQFVYYDGKDSWIPNSEAFDIGGTQNSINYIGYGDSEDNFARIAKRYIQYLIQQGIPINRHGLEARVKGGHSMGTFLTLLERFIKVDIFGTNKCIPQDKIRSN